jgi:hypothetical protein
MNEMNQNELPDPRSENARLLLHWHRDDPEQRLGFRGGRYTSPNKSLAFGFAVLLTLVFFALMLFGAPRVSYLDGFAEKFVSRGPTQYVAVLFFFWGAAMLWMKNRKLGFQLKAFSLPILPLDSEFILTPDTAKDVTRRMHEMVDNPIHFAVLSRVERALSNLENIGHTADVTAILKDQSDNDESQVAASYVLINGLLWAIPVLGFIGTVLGLSTAIGGFGATLQKEGDFAGIKESLTGVTGGLATAFDTTLVALVLALILQLWVSFIQSRESSWLDACNEYCSRQLASRLRLRYKD